MYIRVTTIDVRTDASGRVRRDGQERGLRPLYPRLPGEWVSRAVRLAMPAFAWAQFDALVARAATGAETGARAAGQAVMALMTRDAERDAHWLDWDREKAMRLLRVAGRAA
jgi:hypothetical protein